MPVESNANTTDDCPAKSRGALGRLIPVAIIGAALAAFFGFGLNDYFNPSALKEQQEIMNGFIETNFLLAFVGFAALYMVLVSIFFPGATILTISSGLFFGPVLGPVAAVVGASLGAIANYVTARWMFRDLMMSKAGNGIKKLEAGFRESELSYMFILRLVPLFPFMLVNIAPGILGVKFRNYIIGTVLGMIPGAVVYSLIGNAGRATLAKGEEISIGDALSDPAVLAPIVGLVILACIPIVYKRFFAKK